MVLFAFSSLFLRVILLGFDMIHLLIYEFDKIRFFVLFFGALFWFIDGDRKIFKTHVGIVLKRSAVNSKVESILKWEMVWYSTFIQCNCSSLEWIDFFIIQHHSCGSLLALCEKGQIYRGSLYLTNIQPLKWVGKGDDSSVGPWFSESNIHRWFIILCSTEARDHRLWYNRGFMSTGHLVDDFFNSLKLEQIRCSHVVKPVRPSGGSFSKKSLNRIINKVTAGPQVWLPVSVSIHYIHWFIVTFHSPPLLSSTDPEFSYT